EVEDGLQQFRRRCIVAKRCHERAINLDRVERERVQVTERAVARAEIIEAELHTALAQRSESDCGGGRVLDDGALGDLELESARREPRLLEDAIELLMQVRLRELPAGEVHAHRQLAVRIELVPFAHLSACLAQYPPTDGHDRARLLRERD